MVAYFLQVNVCWLLFYGAYYALFSKETFFRLNRLWLIVSLLCGLALPFVADCFAVKVVPTNLFVMTLEPFVVSATALQRNLAADTEGVVLKTLAIVYALGVAVLAARFLAGLFLVFKLFWQSKKEKKDGFTLVFTEGGTPPFSFFRFIFINPIEFDSVDFQQIMQHEQAHVRQRHSFDVVFMELLNILFWCSPLVYFYKTSLRNVHEYLADEAVLRTNTTPQYGRLLLRQQQSGVVLSLTSNISNHFFSQLKKRILMMTRNKSKHTALIKYALAAPIFLILTAALASPKLPILAKTEVLSDEVVKTIDNLAKEKLEELQVFNSNQLVGNQNIGQNESGNITNMKEGDVAFYVGNRRMGGYISASEMQNSDKLRAFQIVNGKEVECEIVSYVLVRIARQQDPVQVNVTGSTNAEVRKVIKLAKESDQFQFFSIKGRCPDNPVWSRDLGSMSFLVVPNSINVDDLPIAMLSTRQTGGRIRRDVFLACQGLLTAKKENAKLKWRIESFNVTRNPSDPYAKASKNENIGAYFSDYTLKLMADAKENDRYIFSDIKFIADDGVTKFNLQNSLSFVIATPQYSSSHIDTIFKPLSELKLVDEKQIAQMNVDTKEEFNTQITITFKDGHIERYKGAKADMEKIFKKETLDAAKIEAEQKALKEQKTKFDDEQKASGQQAQKLDEMVVVGRGTQKSVAEQRAQKLEDEQKAMKQQKDKVEAEKSGNDPVFTVVDEQPEFPQGVAALFKWLGQNIKYPVTAREAGGQGTVYVGFVVEVDGSITNVKIKRDAPVILRDTITITELNGIKGNKIVERTDYSLGREAVRVISEMPKWKPGKSNGVPVRVAYTLPIKFKLE